VRTIHRTKPHAARPPIEQLHKTKGRKGKKSAEKREEGSRGGAGAKGQGLNKKYSREKYRLQEETDRKRKRHKVRKECPD